MQDPWDNALAIYLQQKGAHNPEILEKQQSGPQEMLYTVSAESWAVPSEWGVGTVRRITVWVDGQGNTNTGEVGQDPF